MIEKKSAGRESLFPPKPFSFVDRVLRLYLGISFRISNKFSGKDTLAFSSIVFSGKI